VADDEQRKQMTAPARNAAGKPRRKSGRYRHRSKPAQSE
jgi:hypothetical protein